MVSGDNFMHCFLSNSMHRNLSALCDIPNTTHHLRDTLYSQYPYVTERSILKLC